MKLTPNEPVNFLAYVDSYRSHVRKGLHLKATSELLKISNSLATLTATNILYKGVEKPICVSITYIVLYVYELYGSNLHI